MVTYALEEAQSSFLGLPESDQQALKLIHQTEANAIHSAMKLRVDTALESSEKATGVIDRGTHLEVDGWKVSKECLGEPTLPKGAIEINPEKADIRKPQAWSYLIDEDTVSHDDFWRNGVYRGFELWKRIFPWFENMSKDDAKKQGLFPVTLWRYNYAGGAKEIAHRGQYYPSQKELLQMINSVSGNCIKKAEALNIPFVGHRYASSDGKLGQEGVTSCIWSSSPDVLYGDAWAQYTILCRADHKAEHRFDDRGRGFLVRPFLDNKRV